MLSIRTQEISANSADLTNVLLSEWQQTVSQLKCILQCIYHTTWGLLIMVHCIGMQFWKLAGVVGSWCIKVVQDIIIFGSMMSIFPSIEAPFPMYGVWPCVKLGKVPGSSWSKLNPFCTHCGLLPLNCSGCAALSECRTSWMRCARGNLWVNDVYIS